MDFRLGADLHSFRHEVRTFLLDLWPAERRGRYLGPQYHDGWPSEYRALRRAFADRGLLGLGLPERFGGVPATELQRFILHEELTYFGVPFPSTAVNIVAPTLLRYGSDELVNDLVPRIIRGEAGFALGYTEANAGSDLAALELTARRAGDEYVVNGTKLYTTYAEVEEFILLATRTSKGNSKRDGISLLLVSADAPGITITPMWTIGGDRTNEVRFDDVRVPARLRIGEQDQGWTYMTDALGLERIAATPLAAARYCLDLLIGTVRDRCLPLTPGQRHRIAGLTTDIEVAQLVTYAAVWRLSRGALSRSDAARAKLLNSELVQRASALSLEVLGMAGLLADGSCHAPFAGKFERGYRNAGVVTVVGGSSEIQRDIIGRAALAR